MSLVLQSGKKSIQFPKPAWTPSAVGGERNFSTESKQTQEKKS